MVASSDWRLCRLILCQQIKELLKMLTRRNRAVHLVDPLDVAAQDGPAAKLPPADEAAVVLRPLVGQSHVLGQLAAAIVAPRALLATVTQPLRLSPEKEVIRWKSF
jgi:hypothetical protein